MSLKSRTKKRANLYTLRIDRSLDRALQRLTPVLQGPLRIKTAWSDQRDQSFKFCTTCWERSASSVSSGSHSMLCKSMHKRNSVKQANCTTPHLPMVCQALLSACGSVHTKSSTTLCYTWYTHVVHFSCYTQYVCCTPLLCPRPRISSKHSTSASPSWPRSDTVLHLKLVTPIHRSGHSKSYRKPWLLYIVNFTSYSDKMYARLLQHSNYPTTPPLSMVPMWV